MKKFFYFSAILIVFSLLFSELSLAARQQHPKRKVIPRQKVTPKPKIVKVKVHKRQPVHAPESLGKGGLLSVTGITSQNFEGVTFPPTSWRVGNPNSGTITWAKSDSGASGFGVGGYSAFMDNYNYDGSSGQRDTIKTPVITGLVNSDLLQFDVAYAYNSYGNDSLIVRISSNGGTSFSGTALYKKGGLGLSTVGSSFLDDEFIPPDYPTSSQWRTESLTLPASGITGSNIVIAFINRSFVGNDLYIDNIKIGSVAVDLEVDTVKLASAPILAGTSKTVSAKVKWLGTNAAPSSIHLTYKAGSAPTSSGDGVAEVIAVTWSGTPKVATATFSTHYTIPSGNFTLYIKGFETSDGDTTNDKANAAFNGASLISSYPYTNNFDGVGDSNWTTGIKTGVVDWVRGTPAKTQISGAYSGTKAWVTKTTGTYTDANDSYVLTPFFDYSSFTAPPILSFYSNLVSEAGYDGGVIEYSYDGITFTTLGSLDDPNGFNWYDSENDPADPDPTIPIVGPFWSGSTLIYNGTITNGWARCYLPLSGLEGQPYVQFRFRFADDESTGDEGWAFDDFSTYQSSSISGTKFNDLNGNGTKDGGEPGIENWNVMLTAPNTLDGDTYTDELGYYEFTNLPAGTYEASEDNPTGWAQTLPGGAGTYSLTTTNGTVYTNKNFGNFQYGTISGKKFNDANANGVLDVGETGLLNWKIRLTGAKTDSALTDSLGRYTFSSLLVGSYTVSEVQQSGWSQTLPASNGNYSISITTSGTVDTAINFGNFQTGSISGMKFNDVNGNGVKDGGETGLASWKIRLGGSKTDSVLTDGSGNYTFTGLLAGNYTVSEQQQAGWQQTLPASNGSYSVTITSASVFTGKDFGNFQVGSISGTKYEDTNGNGVKDGGEAGLQSWKIKLNGASVDSVLTDASGNYTFNNLIPGSYTVSEVAQNGWLQTAPVSVTYSISISGGSVMTGKDFGNFHLGSISGTKYNDLNGNGVKDGGETGLVNWKIRLTGAKIDSVLTDVNGNYSFGSLTVGTYTIREVQQSGWLQTTTNPTDVSITSGVNSTSVDFGNFQLGSVSGKKFHDLNSNGVMDGGETGLQNWKIKLNGASTDSVLTDVNGNYSFSNLSAGNYTISEVQQAGWIQTLPASSGNYSISVTSGYAGTGKDFGNFQSGTISGMKFNDANANAVKDGGETGLANWKIRLSGAKLDSVLTDGSGNYTFSNLLAGNYTVSEEQQAGWVQTLPVSNGTYSITITDGSTFTGKDFGNAQQSGIFGMKFNDMNGNGVKDLEDVGLANWTIRLAGAKIDSAITDGSGNYSFNSLNPGAYTVSEDAQPGWLQTKPVSGSYSINLAGNSSGNDFGNFQLGSISGLSFNDVDGNGVKDVGEAGQQSWKIKLNGVTTDSMLTDVNGNYSFTGLHAGNYTVSEQSQAGWIQTVPASNGNYALTISSGSTYTAKNFGNFQLGSISGLSFNDNDGNGTKDAGENGLQNWKIKLNGATTDSMLTDVNGNYSFTGLHAGNYTVSEQSQAGWIQTLPASNGNYALTVSSGSSYTAKNFGNFQLGTITGLSFNDVNGNGTKDGGENGLQNWKIKLNGAATDSVQTDVNGGYSFTGLHAGNYTVSEQVQNGWIQTLPASNGNYALTVSSGSSYTGKNFGNYQLGSISGKKFNDVNQNGTFDVGEPGILNWKIRLSGASVDSILTDASGNYSFSGLLPGNYTVSEAQQAGWTQTFPVTGTYPLTVSSGSAYTGKDFGNFKYPTISGTVFEDINGNGTRDGGEPGLLHWMIQLSGTAVDSILTDANGDYSFTQLNAGNYTVGEVVQAAWMRTKPLSPATYSFSLSSGQNSTGLDFGNFQLGSVNGDVFNDLNGNGIREGGENGLQNWNMILSDTHTDSVLTDANGHYMFNGLTVGSYTVSERMQNGWMQTKPSSNGTYSFSIVSQSNISGRDFGNFHLGVVSGEAFNDVDGNGTKDAGENGLQDWNIHIAGPQTDSMLTDANGMFSIGNLTVGNYTLSEAMQSGWMQTLPSSSGTYSFSISSGSVLANKDFGNFQLGSISGLKFNDVNGNGVKEVGESGLLDWTITLSGAIAESVTTDANGDYTFANVTAGNYTVGEVQQNGWIQTLPASNGTYSVSVSSGSVFTGKDFGNFQLGTVSGMVFNDVNENGLNDNGEVGIANWRIILSDGSSNDTGYTDANGNYTFAGLNNGDKYVLQRSGLDFVFSTTVDSANVVITSGSNFTGVDFGVFTLGKIGGMKYNDLNGNGVKENGENGLANWKIKLTGASTESTMTDVNGSYLFTGLHHGTYSIREEAQSGWVQTSADPHDVNVTSGTDEDDADFGNFQLGSISGLAYNDLNGNGVKDSNDAALANWSITLSGARSETTMTDVNGNYTFTGLLAGTYTIREIQQSGWMQTTADPNNISVTSGLNSTNVNFGNFQLGIVGGMNFNDVNGNGIKDNGETGLAGWKMILAGVTNETTMTDANGNYSFASVPAGTYAGTEEHQTGWAQTLPASNGTYPIVITSGSIYSGKDFGNFQLGVISGIVYSDDNGNDSLNNTETGLANWVVTLSANNNTVALDTTDGTGNYSFTGITAGTFHVSTTAQSGFNLLENANGANVTIVSGSTSTIKFGALQDQTKYRTFKLSTGATDFASKAGTIALKAVKGSKTQKYLAVSGTLNLRMAAEYVFVKSVTAVKGTVLTFGVNLGKTDAAKTHGWLSYKNTAAIGKFVGVAQTGAPYPIDSATHNNAISSKGKRSGKAYTKAIAPTNKNNNMLWAEGTIFKFNLMASQIGVTPTNFGALTLDTAYTLFGKNLQGASLTTVATYVDSLMTFWNEHNLYDTAGSNGSFLNTQAKMLKADSGLTNILSRINNGFYSVIGTVDSNARGTHDYMDSAAVAAKMKYALVLRGVKSAKEGCSFLKSTPGKVADILNFASDASYEAPEKVALGQNYPNPFNPSTTINIAIPADMDGALVTLKVYNVLGQEVATVINNEAMSAGDNAVSFDAAKLSTGVYFYRLSLNGGEVTAMKKMMLLK